MAKEKKKKGSIVINIFIILLFIVGAGIFTYPTISNYWNEYRNAQLVTKYNESVSDLSDDQLLTKRIMFSVILTMRSLIQMVTG